MAQTIAQLIAAGQEIYDETDPGENTHERVGDAILQIPTTIGEPLDLIICNIINNIACAVNESLLEFSVEAANQGSLLTTGYFWSIWGMAPVTGSGTSPNWATLALIDESAMNSVGDNGSPPLYPAYVSEFGALDPDNNQYAWIVPGIKDNLGRVTRFRPRNVLVLGDL